MKILDQKFKKNWPSFFLQTALATISIFLITLILGREKVVAISSMGATAFICFAIPKSFTAQSLRVIGGHLIGLACGTVFTLMHLYPPLEYSLAVGLAIFLMVILNLEHPPAAGTALAVTIHEVDLSTAVAILIAVMIITQMRYYLRHWLKNLV